MNLDGWGVAGAMTAAMTLPGTLELLLLTTGGMLPPRRRDRNAAGPLRLAVVVPAHNEERHIARTVRSLLAADNTGLELAIVVVADNCHDRTAERALSAGAQVLQRRNATARGKGYALDFAFNALIPEAYDAFLIIDADSDVSKNILTEMAILLRDGADAAQCRYVVRNADANLRTRLMNIALCGFNVLRPRGRERWGLSVGIYGNGFAVSSATLRAVPYSATSVVEDLEYHLALVRAGRRVRFADEATVWGDMPAGGTGAKTQRARWEGGRFRMMAYHAPRLALDVLRGRWRLLEPCLDLLLLPLAFHVTLLCLALAIPWWPSRVAAMAGVSVVAAHLIGALRLSGGGARDIAALTAAPVYLVWKILMVPRLIRASRTGAAWVRTERTDE